MTQISVITTVRNGAATIVRALDSVFALHGSAPGVGVIQHIIIDAASTDETAQMVATWHAAHPSHPLTFVSEPDRGIYDGMNKGLRLARGEWIGILNADDAYAPDALCHYQPYFSESAILHGQQMIHDAKHPNGRVVGPKVYKPSKHFRPMHKMAAQHPTCFVPRSIYEKIGLFLDVFRLAGDFEFLLRAHLRGVAFRYVPAVITHFYKGGATDQHTYRSWREVMTAQIMHGRHPVMAWLDYSYKSIRKRLRG